MRKFLKYIITSGLLLSSISLTGVEVSAVESIDEANGVRDSLYETIGSQTEIGNSEEIIDTLASSFDEKNKDFKSGKSFTFMLFQAGPEESSVLADAEVNYDDQQALNDIIALFESNSGTGSTSQEVAYSKNYDPYLIYTTESEDSDWIEQEFPNPDEFTMNPDYFGLVGGVSSIFENAQNKDFDYAIYETDSTYLFYSEDTNLSVMDAFGAEYSLELDNVTEEDLSKEVIISLDKDSLFLNSVYFNMEGVVNVEIHTVVDNHGEYDVDHFETFIENL